jgi:hypothetical protein
LGSGVVFCAYFRLESTAAGVSRMERSSLVTEITVNYGKLRQITVVLLRQSVQGLGSP